MMISTGPTRATSVRSHSSFPPSLDVGFEFWFRLSLVSLAEPSDETGFQIIFKLLIKVETRI
jgi:hypothetical protein